MATTVVVRRLLLLVVGLVLSGCSLGSGSDEPGSDAAGPESSAITTPTTSDASRTTSPSTTAVGEQGSRQELRTELVDGRWEILDGDGATVRWEAVNVRSDQFIEVPNRRLAPLSSGHVDDMTELFNSVRLVIRWDQLEPNDNDYNTELLGEICSFLNNAHTASNDAIPAPLQVILDPVHIGGGAGTNAFVPLFAWEQVLPGVEPVINNTFGFWEAALTETDTPWLDYLDYIMSESTCVGPDGTSTTLGQHPAVVAIELMNEPHPKQPFVEDGEMVSTGGATSDYNQGLHMLVYDRGISRVRALDNGRPDIPIVVGAYFGGHFYDRDEGPDNQNWLAALTTANFTAQAEATANRQFPAAAPLTVDIAQAHQNLIWTAHSYFTGVSSDDAGTCLTADETCLLERNGANSDYDGNGLPDPDGQGERGVRASGLWSENFASQGCYGYPQPERNECDAPDDERRRIATIGHRANAAAHDRIAQGAAMPFFLGEWGIPALTNGTGWRFAEEFFCDKLVAFDSARTEAAGDRGEPGVAVSWAVWAFDDRVDGRFGLYSPDTEQWRDIAAPFADASCTG